MRVQFDQCAYQDFNDIWNYTASTWGIEKADSYTTEIYTEILSVADKQRRTICPFKEFQKIESIHVHRHFVFMLRAGDDLRIIAILHERMYLVNKIKDRLMYTGE